MSKSSWKIYNPESLVRDLHSEFPELNFVDDFKKEAAEELFPTLEEMYADAKKVYEINNDVGDPVRLNPYYYSRLMYSANDWINEVLKKHFFGHFCGRFLLKFSQNKTLLVTK